MAEEITHKGLKHVFGIVDVKIVDDPEQRLAYNSPAQKPFLRLTFGDGYCVCITANIAEMLGGIGRGLQARINGEPGAAPIPPITKQ